MLDPSRHLLSSHPNPPRARNNHSSTHMTKTATTKLVSSSSTCSSSSSGGGGGGGGELKFKGVRKRKWGKWVSEIRLPNSRERIWLGSYDTPEKAARAFDAAMYYLRGRKASGFNFPNDIQTNVAVPAVKRWPLTPTEIQTAAANYANKITAVPSLSLPSEKEQELSTSDVSSDETCTAENGRGGGGGGGEGMDWSFLDSLFLEDGFIGGSLPPELEWQCGDENGSGNGGGAFVFQQSFLWDF